MLLAAAPALSYCVCVVKISYFFYNWQEKKRIKSKKKKGSSRILAVRHSGFHNRVL